MPEGIFFFLSLFSTSIVSASCTKDFCALLFCCSQQNLCFACFLSFSTLFSLFVAFFARFGVIIKGVCISLSPPSTFIHYRILFSIVMCAFVYHAAEIFAQYMYANRYFHSALPSCLSFSFRCLINMWLLFDFMLW